MREKLLLDVRHRQVVFVIPKMLRIFFKYKRPLQGALCRCGVRALLNYFKTLTGTELKPGIIAVIQTFGRRINFHPHLHFLITDGGTDEEGTFHQVTHFDDKAIARFFSQEVFSLLLQQKLINPALVKKMLLWKHSGFSVHSKVRAETKQEIEKIGKYMIRPLLSLERLCFEQKEGLVSYRYGKKHLQEEKMDYLAFIARVTSHIPDKGQVMIRYYGLYANAHRGKKRLSEKDKTGLPMTEEEVRRLPRKGWAEMIQKVYEVDPLICPRCQGQMKIIAFVTDYTVVDRIIHHLALHFMAERPPPLSAHVLFSSFITEMNPEDMIADG